MELTPKQQSVELIRKANRLLLIARPSSDGDALGSLIAMGAVLKKMGKEVSLVSPDPIPETLSFLPHLPNVKQEFAATRDLLISISLKETSAEKVSYRKNPTEQTLEILVTPKSGTIAAEAVKVGQSPFRFDLVIILDTPDLEQLATVYDAHTQLFFETPVINVDHHAGNDYFGKVNWVDLTATSTAEILVSLIESLAGHEPLWDADIATALLTGLIWDTQSFQSETTTPKSLTVAAQLIAQGARQQEIVKALFKTRPLSTLRLWGMILSGLEVDPDHRFVWGEVHQDDLLRAGAKAHEVGGLMDELIKNAAGQDLAAIFVEESATKTAVLFHALHKGMNLGELAKRFGSGGGRERVLVSLEMPLSAARGKVLEEIRSFQRSNVGA